MSLANTQPVTVTLTLPHWEAFLASLFERDDRLGVRQAGESYLPDEEVDAYTLSAHAETMQSADVDGDLWGTLEDIEETAQDDGEAWQKVVTFYAERGCVLIRVAGTAEPEEWILSEELASRLGLL